MAKNPTPTQQFVEVARELGVEIYDHRQWGSKRKITYRLRRRLKKHHLIPVKPVDTIWQHITVTKDTGKTRKTFFGDMRTVEGIGWSRFLTGCSYNLCFDMQTGTVAVGQPLDAAGAHTLNDKKIIGYSENQNYVALAFSFIGMVGDQLTPAARKSASRCMAALMICDYATRDPDYNPHSMVAYKDCPTEAVRKWMPSILEDAKEIYENHKSHKKHYN